MKTLVVITSLVACCVATQWGYSSIDAGLWGSTILSAPSPLLATRTIAAPSLYAAPSNLWAAHTLAAAPSVIAAPSPWLASRTIAAAPTVVAAPAPAVVAAAPAVVAAPAPAVVAAAPAPILTKTVAAAPAIVAAAPAVVAAAPGITKTQYHSQDELGQASYGHAEPLQTHNAVQDVHGNKVGSFSYVNPHDGQVHRTDYVADALGYRVAANDLPIDTPEVAIAKAAHLSAHAVESVRAKRSILAAPAVYETPASTSPLATHVIAAPSFLAPAPLLAARSAILAAPAPLWAARAAPAVVAAPAPTLVAAPAPALVAAGPALRAATLTTVVNNPGHAVSYRVD